MSFLHVREIFEVDGPRMHSEHKGLGVVAISRALGFPEQAKLRAPAPAMGKPDALVALVVVRWHDCIQEFADHVGV